MHELAICQSILDEVERIARERDVPRVVRIVLRIGPLSGVEPTLLADVFPIARARTVAADADLIIQKQPVRVKCHSCGGRSVVSANRLVCGHCGDYRTELVSGDELLLVRVELQQNDVI